MNLDGMKRVTLTAAAAPCVEEVLRRVVDGIAECRDVVLTRIWLVEGDEDGRSVLRLAASAGNLRDEEADPTRIDGDFARFELGERKIGRIAASGQGLLIERIDGGADWMARPEWGETEGVACFAGQPLVARGETLGVLAVFDRRAIEPEDFLWLRTFADHAALALSNQRAFDEIDRLRKRLEAENEYLRDEVTEALTGEEIVGESPALRKVLEQVAVVAPTDAAVLVHGESGVGKELIARAIHRRSRRADGPLIRVNCAAIPGDLFESEFFGHVQGAFTGASKDRIGRFELADGGTLFLDEIGEIPLSRQSKLLRVLQEGTLERVGEERTREVDVRVVAATNRDLRREVEEGRFRADLYYRLSVFPVEVPPLRARREDVEPLVRHFVAQSARRMNLPRPRLTHDTLSRMRDYDWPGNVRELQHVVERSVILARGGPLRPVGLPAGVGASRVRSAPVVDHGEIPTLAELRDRERDVIAEALRRCRGKVAGQGGAAELLDVPPSTLDSRIAKFGLRGVGRPA